MDTILSTLETIWLIVAVILFFNVMIFVHELGHFLAGKWRGAYIDRFQIWFGKPIWQKEINGVKWGLGWIPAGGFVSLPQLEDMEAIEGRADIPEDLKPLTAKDKIIIAAAGPLFSLLLAYFFACIVWFTGKPTADPMGTTIGYAVPDMPAAQAGILPGDIIKAIDGQPVEKWMGDMEGVVELLALSEHEKITITVERQTADGSSQTLDIPCGYKLPETKWYQRTGLRQVGLLPQAPICIGSIIPGSPAEKAGLKAGDAVTAINGEPIYNPTAVAMQPDSQKGLTLTVKSQDGSTRDVHLAPEMPANWAGKPGARPLMGMVWAPQQRHMSLTYSSPQEQVNQSVVLMGETLAKICAPKSDIGMEHLSGPVGIGNHIYRMLELEDGIGWRLVLWFAVVLNVNLAILNILPLPVVDGGHVVLGIIEWIRGKAVQGRFLDWIMYSFVLLLMSFFLFVTMKDVGDMVGGEEQEKLPDPVFGKATL